MSEFCVTVQTENADYDHFLVKAKSSEEAIKKAFSKANKNDCYLCGLDCLNHVDFDTFYKNIVVVDKMPTQKDEYLRVLRSLVFNRSSIPPN